MTAPRFKHAAELGAVLRDGGIDDATFAHVAGLLPERAPAFLDGDDLGGWWFLYEGRAPDVLGLLALAGGSYTVEDLWRMRAEDRATVEPPTAKR